MRFKILILLICYVETVSGLDYSPWFSKIYEFFPSFTYRYQRYPSLQGENCPKDSSGNDNFFTLGLALTFSENYNGQATFTAAKTKSQGQFHANDVQLLVRRQFTDDIVGDLLSSVAGFRLIEASRAAQHDPGVFVHGDLCGEIHYALGKEFSNPFKTWSIRGWGLAAFALGNKGSPWIRFQGAFEIQPHENWLLGLNFQILRGLGEDKLDLKDFSGYSSIKHQSIDIGLSTHYFISDLWLNGKIDYRIFAKNCPKNALQLELSIEAPFGL